MKVLQVVPGAIWAGMERQVVALTAGLKQAGVDVRTALWHDRETARAMRDLNIPVLLLAQEGRGRAAVPELRHYLESEKIDVVHSHGYKANYISWQASKELRTKRVRTEHGMPEPFSGWAAVKMQLYRKLDRQAALHTHRVIYVSEDLRRRLPLPLPPEHTLVWHNVLPGDFEPLSREKARAELELPLDATVIAAAGRLVPVKDYSTYFDVASRLKGEARFLLFGEGPLRRKLQEENRAKGALVEFVGFHSDFPRLLPAFDVLLFTSRDEGLPTAVLEALYASVVVVAPRVGGIPEVMTGGLKRGLAEARTAESVAATCRLFLEDPELCARFGAEAKERMRDYTATNLGKTAASMYTELLS